MYKTKSGRQIRAGTMAVIFLLLLFFVLNGADGSHIVGGRDSAPHSRPYMASLQVGGRHNCGGALVKENFVLTAAHCQIHGPYTVVLGVNSLSANESTMQEFRTVRSVPHPGYDGHANDIMLLKLNGRAQLTAAVQLISLKTSRAETGSRCLATGWGDIADDGSKPIRLQEVNVTTLSLQTCRRRWGAVPITTSMVCSVGVRGFQGPCRGDSGGPLVCDGAAAGMVSFGGRQCGNPANPVVYSSVPFFGDWIREVLRSN
ncbi:serine protease 57-like [Platichthys flesus]|uniref:serine protease 57-like n=1 Tax=Platichthys flesus TaxID=8260 RepID=UPI002DB76244|nr:serine protease 57-like [Platichthys flesus]